MTPLPDNHRLEGEYLKQKALRLLASHREPYLRLARRALLVELLDNPITTIDTVRAVVMLPPHINPKCFGAVPGPLAEAGIIASEGFSKSLRREAHARPVGVWRLADRDAALAWLAANPVLPLPSSDALFTNNKPDDAITPPGLTEGL